jgi:transcriptional regulator with XRE-family HTH domain
MIKTITPAQCRGARGMLDWTARQLAERAGVSLPTVTRFESGRKIQALTRKAILEAIECGGIVIVDDRTLRLEQREDANV